MIVEVLVDLTLKCVGKHSNMDLCKLYIGNIDCSVNFSIQLILGITPAVTVGGIVDNLCFKK